MHGIKKVENHCSMDSARLLVYFKKFFFVLGLGSTVGDVIMGACHNGGMSSQFYG